VPLRDQRSGDQNQHPSRHSAQKILAKEQTSLDRFAQADFVGVQHAAAKMPQDPADGFDLMRQVFDTVQALEAEQLVEPAQQAQPGKFLMQPEVARKGVRAPRQELLRVERNRNATGR
jgi:hypothetical protein